MTMRKLIIATAISTGSLLGIVSTATMAAEEETVTQSAGDYASDALITTKVKGAFVADSTLSALEISVDTADGVVTLSGTVGTEAEVQQATQVASDVEGVKQVQSEIQIDPAKAEK